MDKPVELIPLLCVQCSTPVPAGVDEVAWVCQQCGTGLSLDEDNGLSRLEVNYSHRILPGGRGKPFWVAEGTVSMQREAYGTFGKQTGKARAFWSQPRRFFVPAFACPLETKIATGKNLVLNPPDLKPGPPADFEPVTLLPEDVKATAEFIIVGIEAGRRDKVKRVDFSLELSEPGLWILP